MHLVNTLYTENFDFKPYVGIPPKQLMIATVPRAGSTYFCVELWKAGGLGAPMEYPHVDMMWVLKRRLNCGDDMVQLWRTVQSIRTSPNGVFGYKMFMLNYVELGRRFPSLLSLIAPTHVVYYTRSDIVGQAVSYSMAIRSKAWFAGVRNRKDVDYDFDHIAQCERSIRNQVKFWQDLFDMTSTTPLVLTYESFIEDPQGQIDRIAKFVEVDARDMQRLRIPSMRVQRDDVNQEWRERYLEDRLLQNESITAVSRCAA